MIDHVTNPNASKLKILLVSGVYPPEYSGFGLLAHRQYKRLSSQYPIEFEVLAGSVFHVGRKHYAYENVPVHQIANRSPYRQVLLKRFGYHSKNRWARILNFLLDWYDYWRDFAMAWQFLLQQHHRFDVFHAVGKAYVTSATLCFAKMFKKRVVLQLVTDSPLLFPKVWHLLGRMPATWKVICISERLRLRCLDKKVAESQAVYIPEIIDAGRFNYVKENRSKYRPLHTKFSNDAVLLFNLAWFLPIKNQIFLLRLLEKLPTQYCLLLAGPFDEMKGQSWEELGYFNLLTNFIAEHQLKERVQLIPHFIENPEVYFKSADIYLLPSFSEGLGVPMLEALACGVPVIAHLIEGVTDSWIKDGENGYCLPLNEDLWVSKIQEVTDLVTDSSASAFSEYVLHKTEPELICKQYYELLR